MKETISSHSTTIRNNTAFKEFIELLTTNHKHKNEPLIKIGQKVWVLDGSSILRLPIYAVGKGVAVLIKHSIYGDMLYSDIRFDDFGKTWFTRISDAKKAYKEHPTFVTPKADKITFTKVDNDTYSIRVITKL